MTGNSVHAVVDMAMPNNEATYCAQHTVFTFGRRYKLGRRIAENADRSARKELRAHRRKAVSP